MVEDVDLPMLKKYNYDVKMAFYIPLVCLSLVLYLSGRQSHANFGQFYLCFMRLATTRVQFISDWRPLRSNLYGRQLHALADSCVQSRQLFAGTLREQLFKLKYEDPIKKSENLCDTCAC
jgi:hypothetical protein